MSTAIEAIGTVAEGALLGRAVEPGHGEGVDRGHTHENACLNCGTPLVGAHCHACGQRGHVHRTIGAFFHDLLHGVFHFEGKLWRTLPLLAWHPGRLTREYIDGRRASYVSPIALFLFVVFLTFALLGAIGSGFNIGSSTGPEAGLISTGDSAAKMEQQIAEAEARRDAAIEAGKPLPGIDREIAGLERGLAAVHAVEAGDFGKAMEQVEEQTKEEAASEEAAAEPATVEDVAIKTGLDAGFSLNNAWEHAKDNPELLIYKLQSNAYKYSWLLIPLSVPFLWLLFPFSRRFHLYDHTVFVTYSLSFMLLILIVASAGAKYEIPAVVSIPVLYAPFHMYRQLRETYGLRRRSALLRTALLIVFAFCALSFWALALMGLVLEF